jgi:uncharacterized protein YciI
MPLFAIMTVDKPGMAEVRAAIRQTHLDYLTAHADIVVLGGVTYGDDTTKDGSVWIINQPDLAAAERFVAAEPFVKAGLFQSVRLRQMNKGQWNPAAADGA